MSYFPVPTTAILLGICLLLPISLQPQSTGLSASENERFEEMERRYEISHQAKIAMRANGFVREKTIQVNYGVLVTCSSEKPNRLTLKFLQVDVDAAVPAQGRTGGYQSVSIPKSEDFRHYEFALPASFLNQSITLEYSDEGVLTKIQGLDEVRTRLREHYEKHLQGTEAETFTLAAELDQISESRQLQFWRDLVLFDKRWDDGNDDRVSALVWQTQACVPSESWLAQIEIPIRRSGQVNDAFGQSNGELADSSSSSEERAFTESFELETDGLSRKKISIGPCPWSFQPTEFQKSLSVELDDDRFVLSADRNVEIKVWSLLTIGQKDVVAEIEIQELTKVKQLTPSEPTSESQTSLSFPMKQGDVRDTQRSFAKEKGLNIVETSSIGIEMVLIPPGYFQMGSHESNQSIVELSHKMGLNNMTEANHRDEFPLHRVEITQGFRVSKFEITRGEFRKFIDSTGYKTEAERSIEGGFGWDSNTKEFGRSDKFDWQSAGFEKDDNHPVVNVSWNDANAFCAWLSEKEGVTFRLPTEAEWEYVTRAGSSTRFHFGDEIGRLTEFGNTSDLSAGEVFPEWPTLDTKDGFVFTAPVGKFKPNALGIYDLHGNVWEWCSDWHAEEYYSHSPTTDPSGPVTGEKKISRGGSWSRTSVNCRTSVRRKTVPDRGHINIGFRIVQELDGDE